MTLNLCLFAHYDRQGVVDPYVLRYLAAIRDCGFDIVLISTNLARSEVVKLDGLCLDVIVRTNAGLDFGSWQDGYRKHGVGCNGELLLANDSVYGPVGDLPSALNKLRRLDADVLGMIESYQQAPHIQSWFVLLSVQAHRSDVFRQFIGQPFAVMEKSVIIARGEIALSGVFRQAGFRVVAPYLSRGPDCLQRNINPTHTLWKELIEQVGVPFLKVELLRDNPVHISNIGFWRRVVAARSPELVRLIENHRNRLSADWAGRDVPERSAPFLSVQAFAQRDCRYAHESQRVRAWLNKFGFLLFHLLHSSWRALIWTRLMLRKCIRSDI